MNDNGAAAGAAHRWNGILHRQEHTVEVHRRLSAPVRQRHLDPLAHDPDPGVRHHHVQTSTEPLGGVDHIRPALLEADVLMKVDRLAADLFYPCLTTRIVEVGYGSPSPPHARASPQRLRQFPTRRPVTMATLPCTRPIASSVALVRHTSCACAVWPYLYHFDPQHEHGKTLGSSLATRRPLTWAPHRRWFPTDWWIKWM